ncbi:MAG TPA: NAD-dependent malic enzyme [Pyrinomonadaceae bacterium]|jgi:malate dehydrogenase (oxaloacetate-decarboxylating)(NADP+)|nr:NAD-dependent malic enzyme [Pyrinomonadaceae bacterium]
MKRGFEVLRDKTLNRSIAFPRSERARLGLRGLLPHRVSTTRQMVHRVMVNLERLPRDIDRYMQLSALQERNERLFYRTVIEHIDTLLPLIYTPTVGEACKEFSHIARDPKGIFITPDDRGQIDRLLANWPQKNIRVIVVTDGQRILGLGDLGANGMGIPVGKLALYSACAGIDPEWCLPVTLDVGTNNENLLSDVLYLGYPRKRLEGKAYFNLVEEFVTAVQSRYPDALIQFEDFLTPNAYALLKKYRDRVLCFNDDIQGTAAVALAGVYASTRITGILFRDLRIMFLGAGSAATGIADLMTTAFVDEGLSLDVARRHLWFVDVNGLVVKGRRDLMPHNLPYAHDHDPLMFVEAIDAIRPHVLIGATGAPGTFTQTVIERMSAINKRPLIFALSNPTSKAECTAEQAYSWSEGRAVFASGSPFAPFVFEGRTLRPAQGNNAYVFPGIGLGAVASRARTLPDELFLTAARTLAGLVRQDDLDEGSLYPPLRRIRQLSLAIAASVATKAYEMNLAREKRPKNLRRHIKALMYEP